METYHRFSTVSKFTKVIIPLDRIDRFFILIKIRFFFISFIDFKRYTTLDWQRWYFIHTNYSPVLILC